ncbi:MAG: NAD(P)-dependent oxidoreductase [Chthoniobacterales bacterium]
MSPSIHNLVPGRTSESRVTPTRPPGRGAAYVNGSNGTTSHDRSGAVERPGPRRALMKAAIFNNDVPWLQDGHIFDKVFAGGRRELLDEITEMYPERISSENFESHADRLREVEVIFSTWDMPVLTTEQVRRMPALKAVFYAAGATAHFRTAFEENGVIVCSATPANAIPVAEFALAQVLLAGAGYWRNSRQCCDATSTHALHNHRGHGNYNARVAILGDGSVSRRLQGMLAHHDLEVVVVSSRPERRTITLEEAFATSIAVVNVFPDCDDNAGVFDRSLFARMMDSAVFINVGRGRQVNEADLVAVMKERPDLTALLDVQWPEPPEDGSELYTVPNIRLSGHMAGSKGNELLRMADYMIEDFRRLEKGEPLLCRVQPDQL